MRTSFLIFCLSLMGAVSCSMDANRESIYNRFFRLQTSTCPALYNASASLDANVLNCKRTLSCIGNQVTNTNFDVIQLKKSGEFWRSVFRSNQYYPALDIPFAVDPASGPQYSGVYDGDSSSILWMLSQTAGMQCLINGSCTLSEATYGYTGEGADATISFQWLQRGCQETYRLYTRECGTLGDC